MRWHIANEARSTELAIIISYPTSASEITVLLKTPTNFRELFPTLFVKTNNFQLVFNFEQTRTVIVWRAWYNGSYTMMAKPITTLLELHYPMIQLLMKRIIQIKVTLLLSAQSSLICVIPRNIYAASSNKY